MNCDLIHSSMETACKVSSQVAPKMKYPDDWKAYTLNKLVEQTQYGTNQAVSTDGFIPIIGMKEIQNGKVLIAAQKVSLSPSEQEKYRLDDGDILLNRTNSLDLVGKSGVYHQNTHAVFASYLIRLKPVRSLIDSDYLGYYLNSYPAYITLKKIATAAISQANINPTELKRLMVIPCPSLPEQRRIAEFLGTWDEAIEKLEQLIAAKEKRFHGLIQMLISGKKGQWATIRLGNLFSERNESNYPLGELLAITGERGVVRRSELDKVDSSSEDKSQYLRIYPGDIGYNTMRMWQGVCGVSRYDGIVSPAYTILVPAQNVNADFAVFYFKTPPVIHIFKRHSQGLVDDTLNLKYHHFSQIRLPLPELSEQNRIAEILTIAQNELNLLRKELAALQKQKRGLMQKLLTGTWRV